MDPGRAGRVPRLAGRPVTPGPGEELAEQLGIALPELPAGIDGAVEHPQGPTRARARRRGRPTLTVLSLTGDVGRDGPGGRGGRRCRRLRPRRRCSRSSPTRRARQASRPRASSSAPIGPRQRLELKIGTPPQRDVMPDLTVTAAVLDGHRPTLPDFLRPGGTTVISVSAGYASAEQLARLAILAADGGQPVHGIFVANPGPTTRRSAATRTAAPGRRWSCHRRTAGPEVRHRIGAEPMTAESLRPLPRRDDP